MKTARYVGGPLDGQDVVKNHGRWSIYRSDDGHPIPPRAGDRQFCTGRGARHERHYAHQRRNGHDYYVHATAITAWNRAGLP